MTEANKTKDKVNLARKREYLAGNSSIQMPTLLASLFINARNTGAFPPRLI